MCGIAGIIQFDKTPNAEHDLDNIRRMTDRQNHRGPDALKVEKLSDSVFFGNNRLKIMDLSNAANMPFFDPSKRYCITFNGEITNFLDLKTKYKLNDHFNFKTKGDTEVLLYLYILKGESIFKELNGMFAFAIYDSVESKVILVRDFFGICPLFYSFQNNRLFFASEIKSIKSAKGLQFNFNPKILKEYFTLAYISGSNTPYLEISELESCEMMSISLLDGKIIKKNYYSYNYTQDSTISFTEAKNEVKRLLTSSVERNFRADAPVGVTLSGGVDTSSMLCLLNELGLSRNVHSYSIKIADLSFDETSYQREVSQKTGTIHHEIEASAKEIKNNFFEHLNFLDEPCGDGATIPLYILAKEAKQNVKVLFSGDGGDELFNAYETHGAYLYRKLYRKYTTESLRELLRKAANLLPVKHKKLSYDFLLKRFLNGAQYSCAQAHIYWRHTLDPERIDQLLLNHDVLCPYEDIESFFSQLNYTSDLDKISHIDLKYFLYGDLLFKNDRMMLAHSVESRFPFLDRELFEFAQRLPDSYRINLFQRRIVQKEAVRSLLPPRIYKRPGFGIEIPNSKWILGEFQDVLEYYSEKSLIIKQNLFNFDSLVKIINEHKTKKIDHGRFLWTFIVFQAWYFKNFSN